MSGGTSRTLFLAAYDVRDEARLRRALKAVMQYFSGGQKSAYECWLSPVDIRALLGDVREVIDPDQDSFGLIPLDPRRGVLTLGRGIKPADPDFFYFG